MLTDRYLNGIPKDSRVNTDGRFLHADQFSEERLNSIRSLNAIAAERGESLGTEMDSPRRNRNQRSHRGIPSAADS